MSEQPLDVRRSFSVLTRHKKVLASFMLVGAICGPAYATIRQPTPTATALVLLPPTAMTSSNVPARDMKTEVVIAESIPVLSAAGRAIRPPVTAAILQRHVTVKSLSEDVLSVRAQFPRPREAVVAADAVAESYITYAKSSATASANGSLSGLQAEAAQLSSQIQQMQTQINAVSSRLAGEGAASSAGQSDAALLGSLRSEEGQVSSSLDVVKVQIADAQLTSGVANGATLVLQKATITSTPSVTMRAIEYGLLGLTAGVVVGVLVIVLRWRNDPRLRLRDDIAGVVGAPVIGSLSSPTRLSASDWTKFLQSPRIPAVEAWALRRILHELLPDEFDRCIKVCVLSLSRDDAALTVAPRLAEFASHLGIAASLHVGDDPEAMSLRAACAALEDSTSVRGSQLEFALGDEVPASRTAPRLEVSASVIDRAKPVITCAGDEVLLAVSAGQATVEELAQLALAASEARAGIAAIVVVNPESDDSSVGMPGVAPRVTRRPAGTAIRTHRTSLSAGQR